MSVIDASALLAYLQGEPGAEVVERHLDTGAACSAVNWAEVAQKVRGADRDWSLARALLLSYDLAVEPVTLEDAERAATTWTRGEGFSLADRLCLALGHRLGLDVVTADRSWGRAEGIEQIR